MNLRPYWRVFIASAREDSANPRRILSSLAVTMFRVFLLAAVYAVAYRYGKVSLPYSNAVWSLAVYFVFIFNLGIRDLFRMVEQDVKSGEVEVQLIKPVDWRLLKMSQMLGKNAVVFISLVLIFPFYLLLLVGPPVISFWSTGLLISFGVLTILAIASALSLFMCIGLTAFWLNDAQSVFRLFDKAIIIFGGGFVPIALLPVSIQTIVRYSPFGIYAAPTQLFNPGVASILGVYLISAVFWTVALGLLSSLIWRRAQLRIEVNGG